MPNFSANITMMFNEFEPLDRIKAAQGAGFACVEFQFIFDLDADDIATATSKTGIQWSVINFPTGADFKHGPLVAATPGMEAEWEKTVAGTRPYVEAMKPAALVIPAYKAPDGTALADARAQLAKSLRYAGEAFADLGVPVVIEPLNPTDRPGAVVNTTAEALAVIEAADHPNVGLEYDVYHMYIMEGADMAPTIEANLDVIKNIQFADVPGRHEPGTGEIDFASFFKALDDMGYAHWTAAEYMPSGATLDGLGWFDPYR